MATIRKPAVDWFKIIADLRVKANLNHCQIGRMIGVPRTRVQDWYNGHMPRYDDGRALLLLHRRAVLVKRVRNA